MEKPFAWNPDKNEQLKARHGFGFEDIVQVIEAEGILDNVANPSASFPHQRLLIIRLEGYPIAVSYVENDEEIFLKTAFPNRKLKALYPES